MIKVMKTEVKFRELPEKVQGFLIREVGFELSKPNDIIDLNYVHELPDWNRATDDERLAYAEWRYPVGTKLMCAFDNYECELSKSYKVEVFGGTGHMRHDILTSDSDGNYGLYLYDSDTNKWAEIISLPDIKEASPSAQQEFVKANPGMQHVEEPKEINDKSSVEIFNDEFNEACRNQDKSNCPLAKPKAGDMVEVSEDGIDWKKYQRHTHTYRGIKRLYDGQFICENQDGFISTFKFIRLPQKSEVESKAKEILETWIDFGPDDEAIRIVTNAIKSAIKWGQANPGKI